ncbi:MAG TPA: YceH family protein [Casimicrobiaceae bacterium]|nr:YceH family protein [Casimicrobiaceae bacterium]
MDLPPLTLVETRVLGVLVEKQATVPDSYPLTLNALVAGSTQKTSRDPVIEASEAQVQAALDRLRQLSLVIESSGGRVMRYAHNIGKVLVIPSEAVALIATLFLRGPQTPGELRIHCERLYRFSDISSVEAYLDELGNRRSGALVAELSRVPGSRETRWMHTLSEPMTDAQAAPIAARSDSVGELEDLRARVDAIEHEMARLRNELTALREHNAR